MLNGRIAKSLIALFIAISILSSCSTVNPSPVLENEAEKLTSVLINDIPNDIDTGKYSSIEEELAVIGGMEKMLDNKYLSLYYDAQYSDIAVLDKRTNKVWFSNRAIYFEDETSQGSDESKMETFSQVKVSYYDGRTLQGSMSSYPDAVDGDGVNQVVAEVKDNIFRVTYTIGKRRDKMMMFTIMTPATYENLLLQAEKLKDEEKIAPNEFATFRDSYGFYSLNDVVTEDEKKQLIEDYPFLEKNVELYILSEGLSDLEYERTAYVTKMLNVTNQQIADENELIGGSIQSEASPYFVIPIEYQLDNTDFVARIMGKEIETVPGFVLDKVDLLPQFAAAPKDSDGFMFIPDGCGALIKNSKPTKDMYSITLPFYGNDYGIDLKDSKMLYPHASLPVYAIQHQNTVMFAIVESGEACAGITATVTDSISEYNRIKLWYQYIPVDEVKYAWDTSKDKQIIFAKKPAATTVSVRYHFLYNDKISYNNMATYYQNYLLGKGELNAVTTDTAGINIEVLGSIYKYKQFFGFSKKTIEPITSFSEASDIAKTLKENGVENVTFKYSSWYNDGNYYYIPSKVDILKQLGGPKEFSSLIGELQQMGYTLYPSVDFATSYKNIFGTGYNAKRDATKFINKNAAFIAEYDVVTGLRKDENKRYLINPSSYGWIINQFMKSYDKFNNRSVFIEFLGRNLAGNYTEASFLSREESKNQVIAQLKTLKANNYKIMVDTANYYTIKYSDYLSNIPTKSSNYRLEYMSVPFVSMVLHGYKEMSGSAVNISNDYKTEILRSVENGIDMNFVLMAADNQVLREALDEQIMTVSEKVWLDTIISVYKRYRDDFKGLNNQKIVGHKRISEGMNLVMYQDGTTVYINYKDTDEAVDDLIVKAKDYVVIKPKGR